MPPSIKESKNEPIVYIGEINTNKQFHDGKLPLAADVKAPLIEFHLDDVRTSNIEGNDG